MQNTSLMCHIMHISPSSFPYTSTSFNSMLLFCHQWPVTNTLESTSTMISSGHITLIKSQQRQQGRWNLLDITSEVRLLIATRKPSYCWQTRATLKHAKNCSNSTCLLRCSWHYWPIFIRLAVAASEICEIPRNSLKIQTYGVQGHPRSSILVSMESPCVTSY